jgi:long-chain acyl-CoA synthetase
VVTTAEFLPKVTASVVGAADVKLIVCVDAPADATAAVTVADLAELASAPPGSILSRAGSDLAALLYTGGTTGRSKGVPLTHAGLFWCGQAVNEVDTAAQIDCDLVALPLAHAYGLWCCATGCTARSGAGAS